MKTIKKFKVSDINLQALLNFLRISTAIFLIVSLAGCGFGNNSTHKSHDNPQDIDNKSQVAISQITTIPLDKSNQHEYVLANIHNSTNSKISLQSALIEKNNTKITKNNLVQKYIDPSSCNQIDAHDSCKIKIFTNKPGGYLLHLYYKSDKNSKLYDANQVISQEEYLPAHDGFIYSANNFPVAKHTSISIPFRLANNFAKVHATINHQPVLVSCNNTHYKAGTLCTALINSNNLDSFKTNQLQLIGTATDGKSIKTASTTLSLTNTTSANLITSAINVSVNPDDGSAPVQVFVKNNGNATASDILINGVTPINIETNTCGTTLTAGSTCSFDVNVSGSIASGQSSAVIKYTNASGTNNVYFNVMYISPTPGPALSLVTSGSFSNKVINTGNTYYYINITNTGDVALSNLQFTNMTTQVATMATGATNSSCVAGQSLPVGNSCIMVLSYNPTATQSGTVDFRATGTFSGMGGENISYNGSAVNIAYSAINATTFVAVGDYGMVISSPTTGPNGNWTADVDSPFATDGTVANGIVINGTLYAVMMNNGLLKFSIQNGLFWGTSNTNFVSSNCGIVFDGTYYYTCGAMGSSVYGAVCTNVGQSCVIRTNTGTWNPLYQAVAGQKLSDIFFFTSGGSNGYVVTNNGFNNIDTNGGLITSNDGVTFGQSNPRQGHAAHFRAAAFNTSLGTPQVAAWVFASPRLNRLGRSADDVITNVTGNWNNNSGTPGVPVTGATFTSSGGANGTYLVTTSTGVGDGAVYSVNGALGGNGYTSLLTTSTALQNIAANSAGPNYFLAVGDDGLLEYSTSPTGIGGSWTAATLTIGQNTNPNLRRAYLDGSNFWVTGQSIIAFAPSGTLANSNWKIPGLHGIADAGSYYVAVDNLGSIYTSTNLTAWTQRTNPSGEILNAVTCPATDNCIAVGDNGAIVVTNGTSGITWSSITSNTTSNLHAITCQSGTCVAVGGTGGASSGTVVSSSSSPYTGAWTEDTNSLATQNLNGISFLSPNYIVAGSNNGGGNAYIATAATPGGTWTTQTSGTTNTLNTISCNNSLITCVAGGDSGTIVSSNNGTSWTADTSAATSNDILSVTSISNRFVATAKSGVIMYSSTGVASSWNLAGFPTTSSDANNLYAVIPK